MTNEYTPRNAEYQSAAVLAADKFKEHIANKRFALAAMMARCAANLASLSIAAVSVEKRHTGLDKVWRVIPTFDELDAVRFLNFYVDNLHGARELARYLELSELLSVISPVENKIGLGLVTEQTRASAQAFSAGLDAEGGYLAKADESEAANELWLMRVLSDVPVH
jgi:hypothetical protein